MGGLSPRDGGDAQARDTMNGVEPANAVIGLYRRHAAAFTKARRDRFGDRDWIDRFLSAAAPGCEILDIGCGPGAPVALHIAAAGHQVTGIDSSPELLAEFRRNLPHASAHLSDMRKLALNRRFGGLLAWDSFFHLPAADQPTMFPIFAAHALPGAPLLFNSGPARDEAIGQFEGEDLYHASLDPQDYRDLLAAHDFELLAHSSEDPDCGGRTVWLARRLPD